MTSGRTTLRQVDIQRTLSPGTNKHHGKHHPGKPSPKSQVPTMYTYIRRVYRSTDRYCTRSTVQMPPHFFFFPAVPAVPEVSKACLPNVLWPKLTRSLPLLLRRSFPSCVYPIRKSQYLAYPGTKSLISTYSSRCSRRSCSSSSHVSISGPKTLFSSFTVTLLLG